ncbi:hypothetical protein C8J56DRAFT_462737 [Mycena floridula]|nr:hypothetical protein C8J56DRAFT_462737 [Mycena floridula]
MTHEIGATKILSSPSISPLAPEIAQLQDNELNGRCDDVYTETRFVGLMEQANPSGSIKKEEERSDVKLEFDEDSWAKKEEEKFTVQLETLDSAAQIHDRMQSDYDSSHIHHGPGASYPGLTSVSPGRDSSEGHSIPEYVPQSVSQHRKRSLSRTDESQAVSLHPEPRQDRPPMKRHRMEAVVVTPMKSILARERRQAKSIEYDLSKEDSNKVRMSQNACLFFSSSGF